MTTATNLKEQDQVLTVIHKSQKGITYAGIHEAYLSQYGIRLGDEKLEPIMSQLEKDKYVTHRAVPGGDDSYYSLPSANDFVATGAYQGKAARDKDMLGHELRIKELELELEVSKNRIHELENKKTYKGLYITVIVLLLVGLALSVNHFHKVEGNTTASDSLKMNSQNSGTNPINAERNENASYDSDTTTLSVDTIVSN